MRCLFLAVLMVWRLMGGAGAAELLVFAPTSLSEALREIETVWEKQTGEKALFNFGNSPMNAKQIAQGAPGDIFISADQNWMDWLQQHGQLEPATRHNLVTTELVMIMPNDRAHKIDISRSLDIPALLGPSGRMAIGNPTSLPAGVYAKRALVNLGLWEAALPRVVQTDTLRAVLLMVDRGEVPLGIVFATEASLSPNVQIVGVFPPDASPPVVYPIAITKAVDTPLAQQFMDFLSGPAAQTIFLRRGFKIAATP